MFHALSPPRPPFSRPGGAASSQRPKYESLSRSGTKWIVKGLEVDAVVELADGRWAAFEIKLGQTAIDQAAMSLSKFRDVVDLDRRGEPAVLGVITATGYGYVRDDGIAVIPIGTLRA